MSFFNDLRMWLRLGVNGFWGKRADFYRDVAKSIEDKELLRDFVEGELAISTATATLDKTRAAGLNYMRAILDAGEYTVADILISTMPRKDHMALGVLRNSPDTIDALRNLAKCVDEQSTMSKMVMKSLVSPLLLIPVGFVFAYVLATVSIPEFVKTAPPEIWTGFNQFLRVVAETFAYIGPWIFGFLTVFTVWFLSWGLANFTADWRYRAEGATGTSRLIWNLVFPFRPLLQMYRDIEGTRFLSDLSYLLKSGMMLQESLLIMAQDSTPWMRKHILKILSHLHAYPGDHVGAFGQGVLSQFLAGRLHSAVRRDSGNFSNVLILIGSKGQEEAQAAVGRSATKFSSTLLILTIGVIVFFYGGQAAIIKSIEDANSPSAVMRREAVKRQNQLQKVDAPKAQTSPSGSVN